MDAIELTSRRERRWIEIEKSKDCTDCGGKSGGDIWSTYVMRQLLISSTSTGTGYEENGGYVRMEFCGVAFEFMELEADELPMSEDVF